MRKEPQIEKPKLYWEKIREIEKTLFPEFKKDDIYAPESTNNFYFAPSWHFRRGLVSEADVKNFTLDKTKKLLSIGSGSAFLEKLLVKLGFKKENIMLSDIDPIDLPSDFNSKIFDMWEDWSNLGDEKYDLIIFPESTLINVKFIEDEKKEEGVHHLISQALQHLSPTGIIRMTIELREDYNISRLEQRLIQEGYKIKIVFCGKLMEIKNETSSDRA